MTIIDRVAAKRNEYIAKFDLAPNVIMLHPADFNSIIMELRDTPGVFSAWSDKDGVFKIFGMEMISTLHVSQLGFKVAHSN